MYYCTHVHFLRLQFSREPFVQKFIRFSFEANVRLIASYKKIYDQSLKKIISTINRYKVGRYNIIIVRS